MNSVNHNPSLLEIKITLGLGLTILSPYYRGFVRNLGLRGDERVLDFGSGSGVCTRHIAAGLQRGGWLDCVDVCDGWMKVIRKTLQQYENVGYHVGQIHQLSLPESIYELVVVHFVLHEIPAPEHPLVIQALGRLLKPNGRICLREPQNHGLSLESLDQLAGQAGLQPVSIKARKIAVLPVYDASFVK